MLEKILKKSLVVGAFLMEFANCGRENIVYYTSENDVKQEDITEKKDTAEETGNSRNKDSYHNTLDDGYSTETQEENKIEISENDAYDSTDSLGTYLSPETCEEKSFFEDNWYWVILVFVVLIFLYFGFRFSRRYKSGVV